LPPHLPQKGRIIYRLIRYGKAYVDVGADACEARTKEGRIKHCTRTLKGIGYKVLQNEICQEGR